jgi:N-acetylglutamate synthase-like GNAT family acetyltransferase
MSQELFTAVLIDARGHILHTVFGKTRFELQTLFASWAFTIADGDHIEVAKETNQ